MTLPALVSIPAGSFVMGYGGKDDEIRRAYPPRRVQLDAFQIGVWPVTNEEFADFAAEGYVTDAEGKGESMVVQAKLMIRGACWRSPGGPPTSIKALGDRPVVHVSWQDATRYCAWLSKKHGRTYRLPTEAEFERAAKGPNGREYPWGDVFDAKKTNVRESGHGGVLRPSDTPENEFGLHDMGGNVVQWCQDWYARSLGGEAKNPKGPPSGETRAIRGASFASWRGWTYSRTSLLPWQSTSELGFRVAADARR